MESQLELLKLEFNLVKENIKKFDAILFSDYLKGLLTDNLCKEIIKIAFRGRIINDLAHPVVQGLLGRV